MSAMILCRLTKDICWICGSNESLSGEHKIKKTDLRRHPVSEPTFRSVDNGKDLQIQGLNSKLLNYQNSICEDCNNRRTQGADRSYDAFRNEETESLRQVLVNNTKKSGWVDTTPFNFSHRTELARYFAKHLGCAIGYQRFAVPRRLSRFVYGSSRKNCISLDLRQSPFVWESEAGAIGPLNSLGGALIPLRDRWSRLPYSYVSAYTTDGIQFIVSMKLRLMEAVEIRLAYQKGFRTIFAGQNNEDAKYRGLPYNEDY